MKTFIYIAVTIVYFIVLTAALLYPESVTGVQPANCWQIVFQVPLLVGLIHFTAFLPAAFFISQITGKRTVWAAFVLLIVYAVGTELIQEYIPPRAFRFEDLTQNIAGIIVGLFFGYYLKFVRPAETEPE